jgi:polyisoprenoid-binding protein YceI
MSTIVLIVVALGAGGAWKLGLFGVDTTPIPFSIPTAKHLTAGSGETLLRIDAIRSSAEYEVGERFVGADVTTAKGSTKGINGEIALNLSQPSASRVGEIVIDLEQLASDNSLRDARLRDDYLESTAFPLATFTTTSVDGLPSTIEEGKNYPLTLSGDLQLHQAATPVTWKATATWSKGELKIDASTKILMSKYGIGPINVAALLTTEDEVTLRLSAVAVPPEKVSTRMEKQSETASVAGAPKYSQTIQPILSNNCASCHQKDGIGSHIVALENAGDAAEVADGLATVTALRFMPPWPASDESVPFQHARGLTKAQIAAIGKWAKAGAPLDVKRSTAIPLPKEPDVPAPRADISMKMAEPYTGSLAHPNDYRCFVLDPKVTSPQLITGTDFIPDERLVLHHVIATMYSSDFRETVEARDAADAGPGWSCAVGGISRGANTNGRVTGIGGWVPGHRPQNFGGEHIGFELQPGDFIVIQMHYHYADESTVLPDQSTMTLEVEPLTSTARMLKVGNPISPVELPCPTGVTGPLCDRNAALDDVAARFGPQARFIPDALLKMCGKTPEDYAQQLDGTGATICDYKVRLDGEIVDVLGHMHELGSSYRMTLNPDTPNETILLDIPHWSFDWQLNYQPVTPVPVKRGDTVRIECRWDRSQRPLDTPRYIVFAEGTEDEMCFSTYTVLPTVKP